MSSSAQSGPIGSRAAPVKAASGNEQDELLPDRDPAVVDGLDFDVPARQRVTDGADTVGQPWRITEHFAHDDAAVGSGLFDHAGFDDGGRDVSRAADDRPFSIAGGQLGDAVHAVLQREDRRVGPEHRRDQRQRRLVVVRFHRDQHDVDATDPGWILLGGSPHCEVAERAGFVLSSHARG